MYHPCAATLLIISYRRQVGAGGPPGGAHAAAAVDAGHHTLRGPAAGRPGRPGVGRRHQGPAARLDRALRGEGAAQPRACSKQLLQCVKLTTRGRRPEARRSQHRHGIDFFCQSVWHLIAPAQPCGDRQAKASAVQVAGCERSNSGAKNQLSFVLKLHAVQVLKISLSRIPRARASGLRWRAAPAAPCRRTRSWRCTPLAPTRCAVVSSSRRICSCSATEHS